MTVSYNNHDFTANARTQIVAKPLKDRAGRTTSYVELVITVTDYVTDSITTETAMNNMLTRLNQSGGKLEITDIGFYPSGLQVNFNDVRDIDYGPHCEIIEMTPLGSDLAWRIRWTCSTKIPRCGLGKGKYKNSPASFNYDWVVNQDERGYTVRTITGHVEIPLNRRAPGSRKIDDQADSLWEQIYEAFPIPALFKRQYRKQLSNNRRFLEFSIIDREMHPNAFMAGLDDWSGTHRTNTSQGGPAGFIVWQNHLNASFSVAKNQPKRIAWDRFTSLIRSRMESDGAKNKARMMIPLAMSVNDSLNGSEVSFDYSYTYNLGSPDDFLAASGMWVRKTGSDYDKNLTYNEWLNAGAYQDPRGYSQLKYVAGQDLIVDLCTHTNIAQVGAEVQGRLVPEGKVLANNDIVVKLQKIKKVDPKRSWLAFDTAIKFVTDARVAIHRYLTKPADANDPAPIQDIAANPYHSPHKQGNVPDAVIQRMGAASAFAVVSGKCLRAQFQPIPPLIKSIGGVTPTLVHSSFVSAEVANAGIPIHAGYWRMLYALPKLPTGAIGVPVNPIFHPPGGGSSQNVTTPTTKPEPVEESIGASQFISDIQPVLPLPGSIKSNR